MSCKALWHKPKGKSQRVLCPGDHATNHQLVPSAVASQWTYAQRLTSLLSQLQPGSQRLLQGPEKEGGWRNLSQHAQPHGEAVGGEALQTSCKTENDEQEKEEGLV